MSTKDNLLSALKSIILLNSRQGGDVTKLRAEIEGEPISLFLDENKVIYFIFRNDVMNIKINITSSFSKEFISDILAQLCNNMLTD